MNEFSDSFPGCFTNAGKSHQQQLTGWWVNPRAILHVTEKRKFPAPAKNHILINQSTTKSLYWLYSQFLLSQTFCEIWSICRSKLPEVTLCQQQPYMYILCRKIILLYSGLFIKLHLSIVEHENPVQPHYNDNS